MVKMKKSKPLIKMFITFKLQAKQKKKTLKKVENKQYYYNFSNLL